MRYDLSVIAPCFNESQNVVALAERLVKTFEKNNIAGQVVFVDDKSTDNTAELIEQLAKKYPNVVAKHHEKNEGIVSGWKTGLAAAEGVYVCLIDADLQNLPEDVGRLYKEIIFSHADVVQGWRNHIGNLNESWSRFLLSKGLCFLLNFIFGMHLRDNKSAFVVCRKEVLEDILSHKYSYTYYQTFVGVAAHCKGYSIREVETLFQDRRLGKSFLARIPLKASVLTFLDVLKGIFEFKLFDHYRSNLRSFLAKHTPKKEDPEMPFWRKLYFKLYILLFPLHHWMISYNAADCYKDLKRSQWLSPKDIRKYQELRLRQLMAHAYHHVPFYRDAFIKNNLKPEDIRTIEDLQKLPIIDKRTIRENLYLGMMSDNYDKRKIQKITTSGSTGEPLVCYTEKKSLEMRWASGQRSVEWAGYRFGDRQVRLWHKYIALSPSQIFREIADAFLSRRKFVPAYEITDDNLGDYIKSIMRFKPVILDGYAESFNLIARFLKLLKEKGMKYDGHKPKGIMSSAQTMPEVSREIIESNFGCGVYDKYGSREFTGGMAYQCENRKGYHVVAECNIIEIIKGDGTPAQPGEVGMTVITDLNNYAMPLIRYRLGDLAVQRSQDEVCPCGRGLPLIGSIEGRPQATIIGINKQYLPGSFFARLFAEYEGIIKQFQVLQEKYGEVKVKIVKGNLFTEEALNEIINVTRHHLGKEMKIDVEFVEDIPLGKNGKRRHSISYLDPLDISKNFS